MLACELEARPVYRIFIKKTTSHCPEKKKSTDTEGRWNSFRGFTSFAACVRRNDWLCTSQILLRVNSKAPWIAVTHPRFFLLNIHVLPCLCWIRNVDVFSYFTQSIPLCFRAPLFCFILANLPTGVRLVCNDFLLEKQLPRVGDWDEISWMGPCDRGFDAEGNRLSCRHQAPIAVKFFQGWVSRTNGNTELRANGDFWTWWRGEKATIFTASRWFLSTRRKERE